MTEMRRKQLVNRTGHDILLAATDGEGIHLPIQFPPLKLEVTALMTVCDQGRIGEKEFDYTTVFGGTLNCDRIRIANEVLLHGEDTVVIVEPYILDAMDVQDHIERTALGRMAAPYEAPTDVEDGIPLVFYRLRRRTT